MTWSNGAVSSRRSETATTGHTLLLTVAVLYTLRGEQPTGSRWPKVSRLFHNVITSFTCRSDARQRRAKCGGCPWAAWPGRWCWLPLALISRGLAAPLWPPAEDPADHLVRPILN